MGQAKQNEIDKQFVKDIREELNVYTAEYKPNQFIDEDVTRYNIAQQLELSNKIINRAESYLDNEISDSMADEVALLANAIEKSIGRLEKKLKSKYE